MEEKGNFGFQFFFFFFFFGFEFFFFVLFPKTLDYFLRLLGMVL